MEMDYKATVNLPKTDFPMRASLAEREPQWLQQWETLGLYRRMREQAAGRPKYLLHDGPPYANGELHEGHLLNKVLKDIIIKSRQMSGMDAPYVPGWDCHGLPIELKVLNKLGDAAKKMSKVEIRRQCRAFALQYVDLHREGFKRLGVSGAWETPYRTLTPDYVGTIIRTFAEIYKTGAVYRGLKPIYWCASCETALAEAEVEYGNHTSDSVYVRFEATDPVPGLDGRVFFVIWTTTPWTLPANLAIAVHPDFEYSAIRANGDTYIMASLLAPAALEMFGIHDFEKVKTFTGSELEGLHYRHVMFEDRICPIILGEHVTLDAGTGCVHTAPGHGQEDYVVAARYGIAPFSPVDNRGVFTADAGKYAGQHVFKANPVIVKDLTESGAILSAGKFDHSYPHCWRCERPVIYRSTPQWFINVDHNGLRERALDGISKVKWVPSWGEERIRLMVSQRPDWCVSRQRSWGVPIPVFYCTDCREAYATPESFTKIEAMARSAEDGIDRWFDTPAADLLPEGAKCPKCGGTSFDKETDILDVWFDSGSSSLAVCEPDKDFGWPVDLYLEGSDQHRGWFQSSLLVTMASRGIPPYRSVVTHGFLVDGDGRKISKKLGNSPGVTALVKKYGADVLRLWVSSENYRQDIRLSDEIVTRMQDAYRRIRNTFRYMLANLGDFGPDDALSYDQLEEADRWALHRMQEVRKRTLKAYEEFDFHVVFQTVHNFCAVDLSSFYLDIVKDRLYTFAPNARERRAAQTVLAELLADLVKLLAPVLVYTCEEVWTFLPAHLRTAESIHLTAFPEEKAHYTLSGEILETWDHLLKLRGVVSKVLEQKRRDGLIGSSLEAQVTLTPGDNATQSVLERHADQLPWVFIVSKCVLNPVSPEAAATEDKLLVAVDRAPGQKCTRCWNYRESVGTLSDHPQICDRCVTQLNALSPK